MTDSPIRKGPIVCFGEILIRLSSPDRERLLQSERLDVNYAGAEANVAVALSQFGAAARMVSFVPDNALGRAARDALRRFGVDVRGVIFAPGRMGLYFVEPGAVLRPTEILYDRADSSFARAAPDAVDWRDVSRDAACLHLSGITPALGANASEAALRAARAADGAGVPVSFDGNYRSKLWAAWNGDGPAILRQLLAHAKIAFIDDRDIALVLGQEFEGDHAERLRKAAAAAFAAFPHLERIAATRRLQHSVDDHDLSGQLFVRDGTSCVTRTWPLRNIVDRIGGGDAFAAGFLYGLQSGMGDQAALNFATAAACLKHSVPGDFSPFSEADVRVFLMQETLDVRR